MRFFLCALCALALASCGRSDGSPSEPAAPAPEVSVSAPLALETLVDAPVQGRLSGELGCAFAVGDAQLLTAMGFVASQERAGALVKRDGEVLELQATETAGFDGLDDGATFNGDGISVEVTPAAVLDSGHEGVERSATLTARADGQERVYEGVWSCGP